MAPCAMIHSPVFRCQNVSDSEIFSSASRNGNASARTTTMAVRLLSSFPCIGAALSPSSPRISSPIPLAKRPGIRNNPAIMATARPKFLAYARLVRLPNAFTAMADPLAGWFAGGGGAPGWHLPLLVTASACFYTSGVVFNDCVDYELDCVERPERPLPSGAVSRKIAWVLGAVLMLAGLLLAGL